MKLGFILSEMWAGIRGNFSMIVSIVLVTFVSLSFVSVAALLQLQVGNMKNYWYDRAQIAIYLALISHQRSSVRPALQVTVR